MANSSIIDARVYIGSYVVGGEPNFDWLPTGAEHAYLLFDPDLDKDDDPTTYDALNSAAIPAIIRGGPSGNYAIDPIEIEIMSEANSVDAFNGSSAFDRDFRVLFEGVNAAQIWQGMTEFARSLGGYSFIADAYISQIAYNLVGPNSNSVINSVLNASGLNFRENTTINDGGSGYEDPSEYPGHMGLLDGSGNNIFTAFIYEDGLTETTVFYKRAGSDKILLEWNNATDEHARLHVLNENSSIGMTTVYMDGLDFADVELAQAGNDLTVDLGSDELVRIEDFYLDRANNAAEGVQTTAFEFKDRYVRIGDAQDNILDAQPVTTKGAWLIDGKDGEDTVVIRDNRSLVHGNGIVITDEFLMHHEGLDVALNIENFDVQLGKSGYFLVKKMGNIFDETTTLVNGVPTVFTTLSYRSYHQSLTFEFEYFPNGNNLQRDRTIRDEDGNIDMVADAVSIVGSDNGDDYFLRDRNSPGGSASGAEGWHSNLPIFSGTGNDIFHYIGKNGTNQPVIHGGGDDVVFTNDNSPGAPSFTMIMPLGVAVSDLSFEFFNLRSILSSDSTWIRHIADARLTIDGLGSITYIDAFIHTQLLNRPDEPPLSRPLGKNNFVLIQTETDILAVGYLALDVTHISDFPSSFDMTTVSLYSGLVGGRARAFFQNSYHGTFGDDNFDFNTYVGFDAFYAYDGNDIIKGSFANNTIYGGAGHDIIIDGGGDDVLYGGSGDDTYVFAEEYGKDTIYDFAGINTLKINNVDTLDSLFFMRLEDDLIISHTSDIIIADYYSNPNTINFLEVNGHPRVDLINFANDALVVPSWSVIGSSEDDHIQGTQYDDTIYSLFGDDILNGKGGWDRLYGMQGNDTLYGEDGRDFLYGNEGNDFLYGGEGDDFLYGDSGGFVEDDGYDIVGFSGNFSNYHIEDYGVFKIITDIVGNEGTDTIFQIEQLQFADGIYEDGQFFNKSPTLTVNTILPLNNPVGGAEFTVNQKTVNNQNAPQVVSFSDGRAMFVWESSDPAVDGSSFGISGRMSLIDSSGNTTFGSEFTINQKTTSGQNAAQATFLSDSQVLFTWHSNASTVDGNSTGVAGRIGTLQADGSVSLGNEFTVNERTFSSQLNSQATLLPDGRVVFTWTSNHFTVDMSGSGIAARVGVLNPDGSVTFGSELTVNQEIQSAQLNPQATVLGDERILFTWQSADPDMDGSSYGIAGRIGTVNENGLISFGNEFAVNQKIYNAQTLPQATLLSDGRVLLTWVSAAASVDGDSTGISARIGTPNPDGSMSFGDEFTVNQQIQNAQDSPQVTVLADGRVVFLWQSADPDIDSAGFGISARLGTPNEDGSMSFRDEFAVNQQQSAAQQMPQVTLLSDGRLLFTWADLGGTDGSGSSIAARVYSLEEGNFAANDIIPLDIAITASPYAQTGDLLYVTIKGVPENAILSAGTKDAETGLWGVEQADLEGLQLIPAAGTHNDITLKITGVTENLDGLTFMSELQEITYIIDQPDIYGTAGNDTLTGGAHSDVLYGLEGHDTLEGGLGSDLLSGGGGDDALYYNADGMWEGYYYYPPGGPLQVLIPERARSHDAFDGGAGTDTLIMGDEAEGLYLDERSSPNPLGQNTPRIAGIEFIEARGGDDAIYLSSAEFSYGNVTIDGGAGNDILYSNAGHDVLYGGEGDDKLSGGAGSDTLYGQDGADQFIFKVATTFGTSDTIQDFSLAQNDTIDISDVLDGFYDPLTDLITDFLQITTSGANSFLKIDQDGTDNGVNFVQIAQLIGITGLTDEAALVTSGNLLVV